MGSSKGSGDDQRKQIRGTWTGSAVAKRGVTKAKKRGPPKGSGGAPRRKGVSPELTTWLAAVDSALGRIWPAKFGASPPFRANFRPNVPPTHNAYCLVVVTRHIVHSLEFDRFAAQAPLHGTKLTIEQYPFNTGSAEAVAAVLLAELEGRYGEACDKAWAAQQQLASGGRSGLRGYASALADAVPRLRAVVSALLDKGMAVSSGLGLQLGLHGTPASHNGVPPGLELDVGAYHQVLRADRDHRSASHLLAQEYASQASDFYRCVPTDADLQPSPDDPSIESDESEVEDIDVGVLRSRADAHQSETAANPIEATRATREVTITVKAWIHRRSGKRKAIKK